MIALLLVSFPVDQIHLLFFPLMNNVNATTLAKGGIR